MKQQNFKNVQSDSVRGGRDSSCLLLPGTRQHHWVEGSDEVIGVDACVRSV